MRERQILAIGGAGETFADLVLELAGAERPRVLFLGTATGDSDRAVVDFYDSFPASRCSPSHLKLFGIPPPDLRAVVLGQDAVYVGGGNTANLLAVWRVHGLDALLREAWEAGVVLSGTSAGSICWFEAGVTDSFREELDGIECLGLLPGSHCPHFDGEPQRRPAYHRLVAAGFPGGLAADDGCALHFAGRELREVVATRAGARAYAVELVDGDVRETAVEPTRVRRS